MKSFLFSPMSKRELERAPKKCTIARQNKTLTSSPHPSEQRLRYDATMPRSTSRPSRSQVRFSDTNLSYAAFIPSLEESTHAWFSENELISFRQRMRSDIARLRNRMRVAGWMLTEEEIYESIGIEDFLSPTMAARVHEQRQSHVQTVIAEQAPRAQGGNQLHLSIVAQNSSRLSRERAHERAVIRYG